MCKSLLFLALFAFACSGSNASGDASVDAGSNTEPDAESGLPDLPPNFCELAACGGELLGTWEFTNACAPPRPAPSDDNCRTQIHFASDLEGTVEFTANGEVTFANRLVQRTYQYMPKSCIPGGQSCESFIQSSPPLQTQCTENQGVCDCVTWEPNQPMDPETFPYEAVGNELLIHTPDAEIHFDYCAKSGGLRYIHEDGSSTFATQPE